MTILTKEKINERLTQLNTEAEKLKLTIEQLTVKFHAITGARSILIEQIKDLEETSDVHTQTDTDTGTETTNSTSNGSPKVFSKSTRKTKNYTESSGSH